MGMAGIPGLTAIRKLLAAEDHALERTVQTRLWSLAPRVSVEIEAQVKVHKIHVTTDVHRKFSINIRSVVPVARPYSSVRPSRDTVRIAGNVS